MTVLTLKRKEKAKKRFNEAAAVFSVIAILILFTAAAAEVREAIISGFRLALFSVIPALFPFLIISDTLASLDASLSSNFLARRFEKAFNINRVAFGAFLCGAICGFPIGARMASRLYQRGAISKNECEKVIGLSSNPSFAFVVSGVGAGIYGSVIHGVIIYFSLIISSVAVGILFRGKPTKSENSVYIQGQSFDLIASVKNAALSSITISSFIVFASSLLGLVSKFIKNDVLVTMIVTVLEISNAAKRLSLLEAPMILKLSLTAFALSFSGICVHMQLRSIIDEDISMRRYYKMKALSAILSFAVCFVAMSLI